MPNVQITQFEGKEIVVFDCMGKTPEEAQKVLSEGKIFVATKPLSSLLLMTVVTDLRFNTALSDAFKDFAAHNKPYVKASALVGISGLQKIIYSTIMTFTGRNIPIFNTKEEAMAWLIKQ